MLAVAAAFAVPLAAAAATSPTKAERAALVAATERVIGRRPAGCARFQIRLSADRRYGAVQVRFPNGSAAATRRCNPDNVLVVFERAAGSWRRIYTGALPPYCISDSRYLKGMLQLVGCIAIPPGQP